MVEEKSLLVDLTSQFESELRWQRQLESTDLAAAEATEIFLAGRLLGSVGLTLELRLKNGESLRGRVSRAANTWLMLEMTRENILVWYRSIEVVVGLGVAPQWPSEVERRVSATKVLREFAEARNEVRLTTQNTTLKGYIQRVGQDFVDVADHGRQVAISVEALLYATCPR